MRIEKKFHANCSEWDEDFDGDKSISYIPEPKIEETVFDIGKLTIRVKESSEDPPVGIIIDIYSKKWPDELMETYTIWYDDVDEYDEEIRVKETSISDE